MTRTAKEIAELIGATLEGDGSAELQNVAAPERAGARDLIYVDAAKNAERAVASSAKVAVAPQGVVLAGKTVLRAGNAKYAFAKAAAILRERVPIAIGDETISAVRIRMDGTMTGSSQGTSVDDLWLDPITGMTLRWDRFVDAVSNKFGANVRYTERASFVLESPVPRT